MHERHIVVQRTARYYVLGEPGARELWIVLHGYSQLARRFMRRFRSLATPDRCIVAPEALNRYYSEYAPGFHTPDARIGATWMTKEDRAVEIADYLAYLDTLHTQLLAEWAAPPARVVLLGFSQGVATAARWAAHRRGRVDDVILWGGYLPPDLPTEAGLFGDARVRFVYGRHDGYTPPDRVQPHSDALTAAGVAHEVVWFDGGHDIDAATLERLAEAVA